MPQIHFRKPMMTLTVAPNSLLMQALLQAGRPVASSCRGDGVCGKCRIEIVSGKENLSPENETEKLVRERLAIPRNERVSCQTRVLGDIEIDTPYW